MISKGFATIRRYRPCFYVTSGFARRWDVVNPSKVIAVQSFRSYELSCIMECFYIDERITFTYEFFN